MLIRPTLLKDFRHRVWKDVWREAGRALATAHRWIFIGYSLPLADVWMLRLLTQSLRSGLRDASVRRISVVDPSDAADRFRLVFREVQEWKEGFAEWIERCRTARTLL
jgi:hypothetical protein